MSQKNSRIMGARKHLNSRCFRVFQSLPGQWYMAFLVRLFHSNLPFQRMLKLLHSVKVKEIEIEIEIESRAANALQAILEQIPALKFKTLKTEISGADSGVDIMAHLDSAGQSHLLACEAKSNGQPRYVRNAIYQLRSY